MTYEDKTARIEAINASIRTLEAQKAILEAKDAKNG